MRRFYFCFSSSLVFSLLTKKRSKEVVTSVAGKWGLLFVTEFIHHSLQQGFYYSLYLISFNLSSLNHNWIALVKYLPTFKQLSKFPQYDLWSKLANFFNQRSLIVETELRLILSFPSNFLPLRPRYSSNLPNLAMLTLALRTPSLWHVWLSYLALTN